MRPRARALGGLLLAAVLAAVVPAGPARAASVTVSLTFQGPSPAQASVRAGDTVVFSNSDAVTHTVRAAGGGWSFSQAVAPGSSVSHAFPTAGTYRYTDTHGVIARSDPGSVVVAAAPAPSASPAPQRSAAPVPTARPRTTPTPSATAGAGVPEPQAGSSAVATPMLPMTPVGLAPSPAAASPDAAPPHVAAGAAPTSLPQAGGPAPAVPAYAEGGLSQGSAHRYGLPAALALLAVLGVASLLVRLLLADPAAQAARRTRAPEAGG